MEILEHVGHGGNSPNTKNWKSEEVKLVSCFTLPKSLVDTKGNYG